MKHQVNPAILMPLTFTFLVFAAVLPAAGETLFGYSHFKGDQWHLKVTVTEEVLMNGVPESRSVILNKITAEVLEGEGAGGILYNRYDIAERNRDTGVYVWSGEYEVVYQREEDGRLSGFDRDSPVPSTRNMPVYPDYSLKPGDTWKAGGTEVFNLGPTFGTPDLLYIDFTASYTYAGEDLLDGRRMELIEIVYSYSWNPDPRNPENERMLTRDDFPVQVTGEFTEKLWWDPARRRNYAVDGDFVFTFFMKDGLSYTFQGHSEGRAVYPEPLDKEALAREIEELPGDNLTPRITEQGVSVALDDIHFVPDQAVMLPGEEEKLRGISAVLSRYPDRDILVVGHTAKIIGAGDGQLLSEQRAAAVAGYLIDNGVRQETQIITRGMGNREPRADNSTEDGRRKNRRVEIIILEN